MSPFDLMRNFLFPDRENLKQVESYLLLEKMNYGGMAEIYKAEDKITGNICAVKILYPSAVEKAEKLYAIFKEARVEHKNETLFLDHPGIVRIYKTGRYRDILYIVMELIEGVSLQDLLFEQDYLSYAEKLEVFLQIARGVQYLHEKGIIHNDINPKNIMITPDKNAKLIDFGIAIIVGSRMHKSSGILSGTPAYMAPEQVRRLQVDYRTDIYSIGVTFYELFCGATPFGGNNPAEKMQRHLNITPINIADKVPAIDPRLGRLIMKCIERKSEERVQDIADICAIVSALLMEKKQAI